MASGGTTNMYGSAESLTLVAFIANLGVIALVTVILAFVWRWQAPSA
jgi:hypothetical protein